MSEQTQAIAVEATGRVNLPTLPKELPWQGAQYAALRNLVPADCTDRDLETFAWYCVATGLNPLAKEVHLEKFNTKRGPKLIFVVGYLSYIRKARELGDFTGFTEPVLGVKGPGDAPLRDLTPRQYDPDEHTLVSMTMSLLDGEGKPGRAETRYIAEFRGTQNERYTTPGADIQMLEKSLATKILRMRYGSTLVGAGAIIPEERSAVATIDVDYREVLSGNEAAAPDGPIDTAGISPVAEAVQKGVYFLITTYGLNERQPDDDIEDFEEFVTATVNSEVDRWIARWPSEKPFVAQDAAHIAELKRFIHKNVGEQLFEKGVLASNPIEATQRGKR